MVFDFRGVIEGQCKDSRCWLEDRSDWCLLLRVVEATERSNAVLGLQGRLPGASARSTPQAEAPGNKALIPIP